MKYSVVYFDKPIAQIVDAKSPRDAIYIQANLRDKKGLNISPANGETANCCVMPIDRESKAKPKTYFSVNEKTLFAIIARYEFDEEFHIWHHKFFNNRESVIKWFTKNCKQDSVTMDDTITLWLVQIEPMTLQILQRLEDEQNYKEMKKIAYELNCLDKYSL